MGYLRARSNANPGTFEMYYISEVKAELRDQIQQLQFASDTLNSDSQVSQNSQPPTKKKALDILFGKEEK